MALVDTYYFVPGAISVSMISAGSADHRALVSVMQGTKIKLSATLLQDLDSSKRYEADLSFRTWTVTGANTRFSSTYMYTATDTSPYALRVPIYIYIRLDASGSGSSAQLIFSPYEYTVGGKVFTTKSGDDLLTNVLKSDTTDIYDRTLSVEKVIADQNGTTFDDTTSVRTVAPANLATDGTTYAENYLYLRIGTISTDDKVTIPEGTLDTNYAQEQVQKDTELEKMFKLNTDGTAIIPQLPFTILSFFESGVSTFINKIINTTIDTAAKAAAWADEHGMPTTASVASYVSYQLTTLEDKYLRKDQDDTTPYTLTMGNAIIGKKTVTTVKDDEGNDIEVVSWSDGDLDVKNDATVEGTVVTDHIKGRTAIANGTTTEHVVDLDDVLQVKKRAEVDSIMPYTANADISINKNVLVDKDGGTQHKGFIPDILLGDKWQIDDDGNAEMESLILRSFLEVPELRYNRVTVESGTTWNAAGAGVIKEVGTNATGLYIDLKLENGEVGSFVEGDICMGIWHFRNESIQNVDGTYSNYSGDNADDDDESNDVSGLTVSGFCRVEFEVLSVTDYTADEITIASDGKTQVTTSVTYSNGRVYIKYKDGHKGAVQPQMTIVAYGNKATNTDGTQKYPARTRSWYATKKFQRYIYNMNGKTTCSYLDKYGVKVLYDDLSADEQAKCIEGTDGYAIINYKSSMWDISFPWNVAMHLGDTSGMTITEKDGTEVSLSDSGYSAFLSNVYFYGFLQKLDINQLSDNDSLLEKMSDVVQTNLYGYGTYLSKSTFFHTATGFAGYDTLAGTDTQYQVFLRKDSLLTKWSAGIYALSGKVKSSQALTKMVLGADTVSATLSGDRTYNSIAANTEVEFKWKFTTTGEDAPYWLFYGSAVGTIIQVYDLKFEKADDIEGICTPFDGLADDGIPQSPNILVNTAFADASSWTLKYGAVIQTNMYQGRSGVYCLYNNTTAYGRFVSQPVTLKANTKYVLSWFCKGSGSLMAIVDTQDSTNNNFCTSDCKAPFVCTDTNLREHNFTLTSDWTYHTLTFMTGSSATNPMKVEFATTSADALTYYIALPKLEEGDKPTAWQLNEADRKGDDGIAGQTGPILRSRGIFSNALTYYYDNNWVDWCRTGKKKWRLGDSIYDLYYDAINSVTYYRLATTDDSGKRVAASTTYSSYSSLLVPSASATGNITASDGRVIWQLFSEVGDISAGFIIADSIDATSTNTGEAFIGKTSGGVTVDADGNIVVDSTASGWFINGGAITHTKTGFSLTQDGNIVCGDSGKIIIKANSFECVNENSEKTMWVNANGDVGLAGNIFTGQCVINSEDDMKKYFNFLGDGTTTQRLRDYSSYDATKMIYTNVTSSDCYLATDDWNNDWEHVWIPDMFKLCDLVRFKGYPTNETVIPLPFFIPKSSTEYVVCRTWTDYKTGIGRLVTLDDMIALVGRKFLFMGNGTCMRFKLPDIAETRDSHGQTTYAFNYLVDHNTNDALGIEVEYSIYSIAIGSNNYTAIAPRITQWFNYLPGLTADNGWGTTE